jgi:DNA-binding winged helix-turn-helix (wHTH) protein/tetratricopeptide (TPR) repeat protein
MAPMGYRFGDFEYDPTRCELRKHGIRLRMQRQPMKILLALLESSGALVTREELRNRIWGESTFVEFEQSLNSAIKRLRYRLSDSADHPRYIETVPGQGYRFLPVVESYELPNAPNGNVSAFPKDLRPDPKIGSSQPASRRLRIGWLIAVAAMIAIPAVFIRLSFRSWHPLGPDDWVLVTRFDNRTGDAALNDVLDFALRRELSNSRFVHVVPPQRVQDTLLLMRKPPDARLDEEMAREICLRDGNIRLMLAGHIQNLGAGYLLSVDVLDPQNGAILHSASAKAGRQEQTLAAIRTISEEVRIGLGEDLAAVRSSREQLKAVTTNSLEALKLFSRADDLMVREDYAEAIPLLERAVALDPEFASAYLELGLAIFGSRSVSADASTILKNYRRAFELAGNTSELERLFIMQVWYRALGDRERSVDYGSLLIHRYPDFYWGIMEQVDNLRRLRRTEVAVDVLRQGLRLRPNSFPLALEGWTMFRESPHEREFVALCKDIDAKIHDPEGAFWMGYIAADRAWRDRNLRQALAQLDAASAVNPNTFYTRAMGYISLGKLEAAQQIAPYASIPEHVETLASFLHGGSKGLAAYVRHHPLAKPASRSAVDLMYASVGQIPITTATPLGVSSAKRETWLAGLRGEWEMSQHRYAAAIRDLEIATKSPETSPAGAIFLKNSLATALERSGDRNGAIRILEAITADPQVEIDMGDFLPMVHAHLADLYRRSGDSERALDVEKKLNSLLTVADSDYSVDAQLDDQRVAAQHPVLAQRR